MAPPLGAATSRWDVAQRPVSAAASVGDGRSPLGCITRGGSRDAGAARRLRGQAAGSQPSPWEAAFSVRYRPGKAQATKGCQAVSLAFFPALRAYKVKGKVAPFLKKRRPKKL